MGFTEALGLREEAKQGVCTSTTRPASPYEGQMIFERDTNRSLIFVDGKWSAAFNWTASTASPSYVTSGLAMYLDAGLTSSYTGTGSTWLDLSGNNNHATLFNTPTYNAAQYSGSLGFDGVSKYATTPYVNQAPSNGVLQSFSAWGVYLPSQFYFGSDAGGGGQFHFGIDLSSNQLGYYYSYYGGGGASDNPVYTTVSPKSVNNITVVKTAAFYYDVYFNGFKYLTQVYRNATVNTPLNLGRYYAGSFQRATYLIVQTYSRALSEAEVLQNYNAFAPRFGI
jgi:hypothetical protein